MKILQITALLIVAFVAFSACAFGSPPTSTKEKPAVVQAHSIDKQQVSPIVASRRMLTARLPCRSNVPISPVR
jgi:hypothetical protein